MDRGRIHNYELLTGYVSEKLLNFASRPEEVELLVVIDLRLIEWFSIERRKYAL